MNLFASVLTYPAPAANYRGESELNRTIIQKVTDGRFDYPIISPEAIRNALREILRAYNLPSNRQRLHPVSGNGSSKEGDSGDKQGLAVKFDQYPDPAVFADDFFFGYLLAVKGKELEKVRTAKGATYPLKRDSILRMNLAKALEPYRHNAVFTQSPELKDSPWKPGGGDSKTTSALLHRETAVTPFQYPFALNLNDCAAQPVWTRALLRAIGELNNVAGNHARSYFEMAPASIVIRLTNSLVAGYSNYGFQKSKKTDNYEFPEVVEGILHQERSADGTMMDAPDYPGNEFYIGGRIVKEMSDEKIAGLRARGVTLDRDPRRLIETVTAQALTGASA